jgi:arginyl-tRNA synthetase
VDPRAAITEALARVVAELAGDAAAGVDVRLERPREAAHGDWASSVALALAKPLRRPPRQIAEEIAARIDLSGTGAGVVEIAGPGFLNFRLAASSVTDQLARIVADDDAYGRSATGAGEKVMVEWVSANPTGPLHLGHGRQAVLGDAICDLLSATGWSVYREFYYNDAGRQI